MASRSVFREIFAVIALQVEGVMRSRPSDKSDGSRSKRPKKSPKRRPVTPFKKRPAKGAPAGSGAGSAGSSRPRGRSGPQGLSRPDFLMDGDQGTRLQKYLAVAGVDSRRNCEAVIREGRVTVDGKTIIDPAFAVHPENQDIRLDGEKLRPARYRYYLINKPKGVVCTHNDPAGRPRAVDLVPSHDNRMFTVGRLDESTMGLLMVTNDGALAEHLAHPRYEVIRNYRVQVAGLPDGKTLGELREGMHFSDGFFKFHFIRILKRKGRSTFLELELREGKNREIRRMLARAGHKVIQLERTGFGPLRLGNLEVGECRELRVDEVKQLYDFLEKPPEKRNGDRKTRRPAITQRSAARKSRSTAAADKKEATGSRGQRGAARTVKGSRPAKAARPSKKKRR